MAYGDFVFGVCQKNVASFLVDYFEVGFVEGFLGVMSSCGVVMVVPQFLHFAVCFSSYSVTLLLPLVVCVFVVL